MNGQGTFVNSIINEPFEEETHPGNPSRPFAMKLLHAA
jgi:hypothetical protein